LTREAYALDLLQYASWCQQHHVRLFDARRADIECFAREMEANGRARATMTRRLRTIAGFYRYAVEEELLDHSPAAHVRRPRLDYESHATGLDRNELGALLVAAALRQGGRARPGLPARAEQAAGVGGDRRGNRGPRDRARAPDPGDHAEGRGKVVTIPLAPRTARAMDLAIGEQTEGPVFLTTDGRRLDRHGAARIVRRAACRTGVVKRVGPHTLRQPSSPPRSTPESRCATCRKPPPTRTAHHRALRQPTSLDRHATYIVAAYLAGAAQKDSSKLSIRRARTGQADQQHPT
jgi:integrase/recombinase XerD